MPVSPPERAGVLAAAGLVGGADGYDLDALERYAAARGWTCTTTPSSTMHGRRGLWRASVFAPKPVERSGAGTFTCARASGRSEAEALANALASALGRER